MTLLNRHNNDTSDYLDACDAITDEGATPDVDLESLWRRVAFSVAIHNTDDHMRNHGFLRSRGGWNLAPPCSMSTPSLTSPKTASPASTVHAPPTTNYSASNRSQANADSRPNDVTPWPAR
jgi:serine/threonine-protein kinase HipA